MQISRSALVACAVIALMAVKGNAMHNDYKTESAAKELASQQKHIVRVCNAVAENNLMQTYNKHSTHKMLTVETPEACAPVLAGVEPSRKVSTTDIAWEVNSALNHSHLREVGQSIFADSFLDQVHQLDTLEKPDHKTQALTNLLDAMDTVLLNYETQHNLGKTKSSLYTPPSSETQTQTLEDVNKALRALFAKDALNDLPNIQPTTQEAKTTMALLKLDPLSPQDVKAYQATFEVPVFTRLINIASALDRVTELQAKVSPPQTPTTPHTAYSTEYTRG